MIDDQSTPSTSSGDVMSLRSLVEPGEMGVLCLRVGESRGRWSDGSGIDVCFNFNLDVVGKGDVLIGQGKRGGTNGRLLDLLDILGPLNC